MGAGSAGKFWVIGSTLSSGMSLLAWLGVCLATGVPRTADKLPGETEHTLKEGSSACVFSEGRGCGIWDSFCGAQSLVWGTTGRWETG